MISLMLRSEGSGPSLSSRHSAPAPARPSPRSFLLILELSSPCPSYAPSYPRLALRNPVGLLGTTVPILHQILVSNMP